MMKFLNSIIVSLLLFCGYACQHEELEIVQSVSKTASTRSAGLEVDANGYYKANKRIPLVGEGRIIDDLSSALIQVINLDQNINNLLDLDIDNAASFSGVADITAIGNQIVSVKDINRIYAGGQDAGFVYKISDNKLLTVNILKGFWIATYLNGVQQEMKGGNTSGSTLELNLLGASNDDGKQTLSISTQFTKPFDEIKLGVRGVDVSVVQSLKLYYAFVGENAIKPSTPENFPGVKINRNVLMSNAISIINKDNLVDSDLTNSAYFGTVGSLLQPFVTVNFGEDIPAGSEVGFCISNMSLLSLDLLAGSSLITYDENDKEVENVTIGSLLGLSLISGSDNSFTSIITKAKCRQIKIIFYGVSVDLGGKTLRYAFVRDPFKVDISSYYSLSDAQITTSVYHFHRPANGQVSFAILSNPQGASPQISENRILGMTLPGKYKIAATYTSETGEVFTQTVTLTREETPSLEGCYHLITKTDYPAVTIGQTSSGSGCLLCLAEGTTSGHGPENIINENTDDYTEYYNALSLASNTRITGIKIGQPINAEHNEVRVGFTLQATNQLLGVDLLKFFVVKLYKEGTEVKSSAVDNSSVANVGLIGGQETRLRMSISTTEEFDAIELWTAGVLNLTLSTFRIYNAFWEPVQGCENIGSSAEACIEMITPASHGATINYNATGVDGVAAVAGEFVNLGNVIDDDKESHGTITFTSVAAAVTLAVQFDQLPAGQTIGFIIHAPEYVADVNLLSNITLTTYRKGQKIQTSTSDAGVLGLQLISYAGKQYIEMAPTLPYDEVRITFAAVADLLKVIDIYGVFTRLDSDNNGIPDCAEDPDDVQEITNATAYTHNCDGNIEIFVDGGIQNKNYKLIAYNYAANNAKTEYIQQLQSGNKFVLTNMPVGDYYIYICNESEDIYYFSGIHSMVPPSTTTWKTDAVSSAWNEWHNWTNGIPWDCTDVLIPENCVNYPVLKKEEENTCRYIHFGPNSEVVNTQYLTYVQAWIDLVFQPNRYYMLSIPLKDTYSGDLFIPAVLNGIHNGTYFTTLDETACPQNRFNPSVYQRSWNKVVKGVDINGTRFTTPIMSTLWTQPYNTVDYLYENGQGFSFYVDNGTLSDAIRFQFRLPKIHPSYNYYLTNQTLSALAAATITRSAKTGRFIYENDANEAPSSFTATLTNQAPHNILVAGNPFMAHLDIAQMLDGNPDIRAVRVYDGSSSNQYIDSEQLPDLVKGKIRPMEAFFVVLYNNTASFDITLKPNMVYQGNGFGNE